MLNKLWQKFRIPFSITRQYNADEAAIVDEYLSSAQLWHVVLVVAPSSRENFASAHFRNVSSYVAPIVLEHLPGMHKSHASTHWPA